MRLRAKGNVFAFRDFSDMVFQLARRIMPDVKFIENSPDRSAEPPIVTYQLVSKVPDGEIKPRVREVFADPNNPGDMITLYGQRFRMEVQFLCWEKTPDEVEKLAERFEEFMLIYTGFLKENGIVDILYRERTSDLSITKFRESVEARALLYTVRTELLYPVSHAALRTLKIEFDILGNVRGTRSPVSYWTGGLSTGFDKTLWYNNSAGGYQIVDQNGYTSFEGSSIGVDGNDIVSVQQFSSSKNNVIETTLKVAQMGATFHFLIGNDKFRIGFQGSSSALISFAGAKTIYTKDIDLLSLPTLRLRIRCKGSKFDFSIDSGTGYQFFGEGETQFPEFFSVDLGVSSTRPEQIVDLKMYDAKVTVLDVEELVPEEEENIKVEEKKAFLWTNV